MVDRKIFTHVKNKKQLALKVNKSSRLLIEPFQLTQYFFNPFVVWNKPFGVDVPLTEKSGR